MLHVMSHEGLAERSEHGRPINCEQARPMQSKNDHDTKEEYRGWSGPIRLYDDALRSEVVHKNL